MTKKLEPLTIKELIFNGNQDPDHPAIETPGQQPLTYKDLRKQVLLVIKALNSMGFGRNDRIAVIMPGGPVSSSAGHCSHGRIHPYSLKSPVQRT